MILLLCRYIRYPILHCLAAVALSYSIQIAEEGAIPVTSNDVSVDALVSPAGFIPISPAAWERYE